MNMRLPPTSVAAPRCLGARHGGPPGDGGGNRLLAAMPCAEAARLAAALEPLRLEPGAVLYERGERVEHVIFPDSGAVSLLTDAGSGRRAEIALIGREGLLGLSALLGGRRAPFQAVVPVGGEARRLPVGLLRSLLHRSFAVRDLLLRYTALCLAQAANGAACNALHPLRARAARRLLEIQDRTGPGFMLTQDVLADMLGARRPTVNAVLQELKAEGVIATARGRIAITGTAALEAAACDCRQRLREVVAEILAGDGHGIGAAGEEAASHGGEGRGG